LDDGRADSLGVARKTGPATAAMPLERGEAEMEEDNVIPIGGRLRDGREIKTEKDHQQWLYEYFDKDLLRLILFQLCYPFRDEAIQLSVGECLQPWTILFLNHSHGKR
jgi:hypothetical protein